VGGGMAGGAGLVSDPDGLTEPLRQPRGHDSRHDVGSAAGRKADDPAQRPHRVGLRAGATRYGGKDAGGAREVEKSTGERCMALPSLPRPAALFYYFTSFAPVMASR